MSKSEAGLTDALPMSGGAAGPSPSAVLPQFPGLEVLEELAPGVGGMGVVYKAREISLDRLVAVKTLKSRLDTPSGLEFFQHEARAAAHLDHPNILRIYGFSPEHTPPFYVMQLLEGRRLDQACRGRDPLFIAGIFERIARALAYAHGRGVVHRDIKPSNILVNADDQPHIADFGVAGRIQETGAAGERDSPPLVGTAGYIAPEIYAGSSRTGPAIDIYALGVTLYETLVGRPPFAGSGPEEIRASVLRGQPPLPLEVRPMLPEPLQRICLKAMERDPADRYQSADAMADDLRRFIDGREVAARPTRYQAELQGRIRGHLAEIRLWHEQSLIDVADMDRLARPYNAIGQALSPWRQLSRRFPWESIVLRLGGWLVVLSSVLWPLFYWDRLSRTQRVWAVGAPTLAINAVGWFLRSRGSRINSLIYLATGALLLPLLVSIVLTEYRIAPHAQSASRELFGERTQENAAAFDSVAAPRQDFAPTNLQLTISAGFFVGYCAVLLLAADVPILALWFGIGLYLIYGGVLLLAGLREWLENEHIARAIALFLLLPPIFVLLSYVLRRPALTRRFSPILFALFPLPFVVGLSLLSRYGAMEWLHVQWSWDNERINQGWMLDGLILLAVAALATGAPESYIRFWGALLMLLVPVYLLAPTQLLFDKPGHDLFLLGGQSVTQYEVASLALAVALMVIGTCFRQQALILPALLGLATFFLRATERHFRDYLAWPLAIALVGGLGMVAALISLLLRARRRHEPMI